MNTDTSNTLFDLAYKFVNETNSTIFLTGKAGTGKTTFLQYVKKNCIKNIMVVAPTGVAAINAGGVTMHSFFQLPFGPYVANAQRGFGMNENIVDRHTLVSKLRISNEKRKIIEELELLIIDEVSMLRCDMLDAMDTILQYIRRKQKPFGGVQVLFIGDLHQLPPVVKDNEKELFTDHYKSPFFFHAHVFQQLRPVFIELKKIYRQKEQSFIDLLNHVRNNNLTNDDYELLDSKYDPNFYDSENKYITLCSHNYKADTINQRELERLQNPLFEFKGEIKNEYNENALPTPLVLQFKVGCQVMFIKNDSSPEKKYYNGKLATITEMKNEKIVVKFQNENDTFEVSRETWDNITYVLDGEKNEINEKVIGQYTQYPLRLAWAITIHKSQGLTFDYAIIDAGDSFSAGQVYVALSRCTSFDGIVLRTPISRKALPSDLRIFEFHAQEMPEQELNTQLQNEREVYDAQRLLQVFDWRKMQDSVHHLQIGITSTQRLRNDEVSNKFVEQLSISINKQVDMVSKFNQIASDLLNEIAFSGDVSQLKIRTSKAIIFFTNEILHEFILSLHEYVKTLLPKTKAKRILEIIGETEQTWWIKLKSLEQLRLKGELLLDENLHKARPALHLTEKTAEEKSNRIKKQKPEKGSSFKETFAYYSSGKTIEEIATLRALAVSTIESHLCEFIRTGELGIEAFLTENEIEAIRYGYNQAEKYSTTEIKAILLDKYSHGQLKMGIAYLFFKNKIKAKEVKEIVL
jgi:hypothetical protein